MTRKTSRSAAAAAAAAAETARMSRNEVMPLHRNLEPSEIEI
eukprot:CAMPEP_0206479758 /NCGR_PEP_ID=MMETSP0324_2-20121206/36861_1 /ASSEMBLY_ACC=CAM_ASM_000836 /TAXON_ID=2866 /ORGANISM="Crypthecodinium cohnii, Strain Seligo" /LENGTH=41 /DNA_ID= /DNA_START= /DNA_END= /DNA_ORIENTATION=